MYGLMAADTFAEPITLRHLMSHTPGFEDGSLTMEKLHAEQHIFAPLGMEHSTFRQPLPQGLAVDLAAGYNYANGRYVAGPFLFDQAYPAGSMSATAADIGRTLRFVDVEPDLLQDLDDPGRQLVYRTGPGGRLFLMNGQTAFFRTPWYGSRTLHLLLSLGGTLLFACALVAPLIAVPVRFFTRRRKRQAGQSTPLPAQIAR
jgi:CubicO group peptidase (beta-lactamase class C family)